jgi:hypothetical protein
VRREQGEEEERKSREGERGQRRRRRKEGEDGKEGEERREKEGEGERIWTLLVAEIWWLINKAKYNRFVFFRRNKPIPGKPRGSSEDSVPGHCLKKIRKIGAEFKNQKNTNPE